MAGVKIVGGVPIATFDTAEERDAAFARYLSSLTSVPRVRSVNIQRPLAEVQRNLAADGRSIPIVYGRAQVGGWPTIIDYDAGTWTILYVVAMGEINSYQAIYLNGALKKTGVTINEYRGTTTQTADSLLSAAIAGYADDLVITDPVAGDIGIAYIVVQYTDSDYDDWPKVICEIEGKKVWNPKTQTTVYSANPALHLGDLVSSAHYGLGHSVDDTDLEAAQDYADDTTPGEARRESYTIIDSPRDTSDWVEVLRAYASSWIVYRGSVAHIIPDKAGSSVKTITDALIVEDSIKIIKKDSVEMPTVVRASYTDDSENEWRERICDPAKAAGVDAGTTPWREQRIRLVGCRRHSQAYRECVERLNKLTLSDLVVQFTMFDDALGLEVGDIVQLTTAWGLTNKLLRLVEEPREVSPGRWAIEAAEYDPAAYSDQVVSQSTFPDGNLPPGGQPDPPTGVTAVETIYQLNNTEYASRIDVTWTAPTVGIVTGYNVVVKDSGSNVVWTGSTTGLELSTSPLQENETYTVEVQSYTPTQTSVVASDSVTLNGKTGLPAAPTALAGSNQAGDVRLWWTASTADDVRKYEIRYYTTAQAWADGTVLDVVDGLNWSVIAGARSIADGTWRFAVKAIDSVGNYSSAADEVDIVVDSTPTGVTIFFSDTEPTANATNDIWYDTDDNNHPYRWSGSAWVSIQDTTGLVDLTTIQTSNFTAIAGEVYPVDTTAQAVTMTLPLSPSNGDTVWFFDYDESWHVNDFTIARNGQPIMGLTEDMTADVIYFSGGLLYMNATVGWLLI